MTPFETLRRSLALFMAENGIPSQAALARRLRDGTHPTGWDPSTVHSVLGGGRPSRALMTALSKLRREDGTPLPACAECGWAGCSEPNAHPCDACGGSKEPGRAGVSALCAACAEKVGEKA